MRPGKAATPGLTVHPTMEILRSTVPRLEELTDGVRQPHLGRPPADRLLGLSHPVPIPTG
jgi:hypothetical protein